MEASGHSRWFERLLDELQLEVWARKLAVLLHHLWASGEVYEPLHHSNRMTVAQAA